MNSGGNKIQDTQLIERFLLNQLTEEEAILFNKRMDDQAFSELLAKNLLSVRKAGLVKAKLKANRVKSKRQKTVSLIALALLAILVLGIFYFFLSNQMKAKKTQSPEQILATYYEPYPNLFSTKSPDDALENMVDAAMLSYDKGNFVGTVDSFRNIDSTQLHNNDWLVLYYGIALLEADKANSALIKFQNLTRDHSSEVKPLANWYNLMALLKMDRKVDACILGTALIKSRTNFKYGPVQEIVTALCD